MRSVLVVNPPSRDRNVNRDMAGGLGYSAGAGVVLPPLDLLNIATTLRKKKWNVKFVDGVAERRNEVSGYLGEILKGGYEVIVGNLSLPTVQEDEDFYKKIKDKFPNIKVIVKTGINYKIILERFIKNTKVDLVIFGECDLNIEEYIEGKEKRGSARLEQGKIVVEKPEELLNLNLDSLPIPARELGRIELYKYTLLPGITTTMQTSRGCPYPCSYYCPYPLVQGTRWRAMGAVRIVKEMKVIKKLGINNILFRDATFTLDKKRILEMCRLIVRDRLKISWWCETRINVLDEELLRIMKKAGCEGINVGVETMDEELIKREGKPGVVLKDVIAISKTAKKLGMKLHFLMIAGLPNDNLGGLYRTFEYLLKLKPESVGISSITPYPGTKLFEKAASEKLILNFDWNNFNGANSNMKTKYLSVMEITAARKMIMAGVMFNNMDNLIGLIGVWGVRSIFKLWKWTKRQ